MNERDRPNIRDVVEEAARALAEEQAKVTRGEAASTRARVVASAEWLTEQQQRNFEDVRAEVADLGSTIAESAEGIQRGFVSLDHRLEVTRSEIGQIRESLNEGPQARRAREFLERGEHAMKSGFAEEAIRCFLEVERLTFEEYRAYVYLAELFLRRNEVAKALEYLDKTVKFARSAAPPTAAKALTAAASLHEGRGDLARAYENASEARRLDPLDPKIAHVHAQLAARRGRHDDALHSLRDLFRQRPYTSFTVSRESEFGPIRDRVLTLIDELRGETTARVEKLLATVETVRHEIAVLLGIRSGDLVDPIESACYRVRTVLNRGSYLDAADAERLGRRVRRETWGALVEAYDRRLAELHEEDARLSAEVNDAEYRAGHTIWEYSGRGFLVWWLSSFLYVGLGLLLLPAMRYVVFLLMRPQTTQEMWNAGTLVTFVFFALVAVGAILTGLFATKWSRRRAGDRFRGAARRASREREAVRDKVGELAVKRAQVIREEGIEPRRGDLPS
ncbi:MAG: tetratricopeptide repeat protein [Candidatus Rokubacteria bacterium]|nr:tetratricopeptide repeat protein [Candidatus Rokubacteria bacterium]